MEKKLLTIIVLVTIASLSIAGCTSSTNSNQAASNASQAASTTANTTTSASAASAGGANKANSGANNANGAQTKSTTIPTAISFIDLPISIAQGDSIKVTFEVTSNGSCTSGLPASLSLDGASVGQLTSAQGSTGCQAMNFNSGPLTTPGQHVFSVSFAGNAQYGPSSGQVTFTVRAAGGTSMNATK